MGILGLTEQFVNNKISFTKYELLVQFYKEECARFNTIPDYESETEMLSDETVLKQIPVSPDDRSITQVDELHLMLLRHWSLYDALLHSSYVATRLGVWKEQGRKRLVNLMASSGLPLNECLESHQSMSLVFKSTIGPKLRKWAPRFNMPEIVFPSFERRWGYRCLLSASDGVYAISALMDCGTEWIRKHSSLTVGEDFDGKVDHSIQSGRKLTGVGSGLRAGVSGFTIEEDVYGDKGSTDARAIWTRNFFIAYDALSRYFPNT